MSQELLNHKSKCRLCFGHSEVIRNMQKMTKTIQRKFFKLTNVELKLSDKFSNSICRTCIKSLNESSEFQLKMIDNQQRLYAFENEDKLLVKIEPIDSKTMLFQEINVNNVFPKVEVFDGFWKENPMETEQFKISPAESFEDFNVDQQSDDSRDETYSEPKGRSHSDKLKDKALNVAKSSEMTALEASRHFQVPKTSLRKKFNEIHPREEIFLTEQEEAQVRFFVKNRNEAGVQATNEQIINCAVRTVRRRKKGYKLAPTAVWTTWVENFRDRHANYSEARSDDGSAQACDLCNFTALKKKDLRVHMKCHVENKLERVPRVIERKHTKEDLEAAAKLVTSKSMTTTAAAKLHGIPRATLHRFLLKSDEEHQSKILNCLYCERIFTNDSSLRSHIQKHLEPKGEFTCEECGKIFSTRPRLENHKIYHKPGVFRCTRCDLVFDMLKDAQNHTRTHRERVACEICGRLVLKGSDYNKHMRVHGEPKFKCSFEGCSKAYFRKSQFKYHISTHDPNASIKCPECESTFPNKKKLKAHQDRSHGEVRFFCMIESCDYKSNLKENLRRHLKKHKEIDIKLRDELIASLKGLK